MVFKMAVEIISVLWRLFNVIFLTYLCNSEMDGCIGCQYKERQTGKKSKLWHGCYVILIVGDMQNSFGRVHKELDRMSELALLWWRTGPDDLLRLFPTYIVLWFYGTNIKSTFIFI